MASSVGFVRSGPSCYICPPSEAAVVTAPFELEVGCRARRARPSPSKALASTFGILTWRPRWCGGWTGPFSLPSVAESVGPSIRPVPPIRPLWGGMWNSYTVQAGWVRPRRGNLSFGSIGEIHGGGGSVCIRLCVARGEVDHHSHLLIISPILPPLHRPCYALAPSHHRSQTKIKE